MNRENRKMYIFWNKPILMLVIVNVSVNSTVAILGLMFLGFREAVIAS
jgi:hypothetical protein